MLLRLDTLRFSEREDYLKFLSLLRLNISVKQIPVVVKAKYFSKTAERRIRGVGGACVHVA